MESIGQENRPMRYTVVLEREEDGGYVASVPALPGCVSQGDNRAEALNNIREAIELYIEDCRDAGDPIPTEAGKEFVEIEAATITTDPRRCLFSSPTRSAWTRHGPPWPSSMNSRTCRPSTLKRTTAA